MLCRYIYHLFNVISDNITVFPSLKPLFPHRLKGCVLYNNLSMNRHLSFEKKPP